MSNVEIRLIGTREECLAVVELLSHVAPVRIRRVDKADRGTPASPRRRVYAEIHTRTRENP